MLRNDSFLPALCYISNTKLYLLHNYRRHRVRRRNVDTPITTQPLLCLTSYGNTLTQQNAAPTDVVGASPARSTIGGVTATILCGDLRP